MTIEERELLLQIARIISVELRMELGGHWQIKMSDTLDALICSVRERQGMAVKCFGSASEMDQKLKDNYTGEPAP